MADIFVSYASEDLERVKPLVAALEKQGWSVWWDRELVAGPSFDKEIERALDAAHCVVVVWSRTSIESRWVRTEANEGIEREVLVPLLIDNVKPPLAFRIAQTVRMVDWPEQTGQLEKVLEGITQLVGKSEAVISKQRAETPTQRSIAVLPFTNISSDPENEYFSDGISEEILDTLVNTNRLPVIARTSSFQFKGKNLDIKEIGGALGVTHILEGSVRKANNNVRITAQLIDVSTGVQLWSETFARELLDVFAIQDEIASKITNKIDVVLTTSSGSEQGAQNSRGTTSIDAYELYLRARYFAHSDNPFEIEKAIGLFEQCIGLDSEYADAWADLGWTYATLANVPIATRVPSEVLPIAIDAYRRALNIDPKHTRAMGGLGWALMQQEFQWNEGVRLMERSLALNPLDAEKQGAYGWFLFCTGQEKADSVLDKAYRLNPLDPTVRVFRTASMALSGRVAEATSILESTLVQNLDGYRDNFWVAFFATQAGKLEVARKHLAKARDVVGADFPGIRVLEYFVAASEGKDELAGEIKAELLDRAQHTSALLLLGDRWSENEFVDIWNAAIDYRHNVWTLLFQPKPVQIPESDWQRIRKLTRATEFQIGVVNDQN